MSYVFAICTTASRWGDRIVRTTAGEAWAADDPFVKDRPDLFADRPQTVRQTPAPVETATASPGERRNIRRTTEEPKGGRKS